MTDRGQGRCVLVTGASRGIGRHGAVALAEAGFTVLAGVRSDASAAEVDDLNIARLRPVRLDITRAEDIAALRAELTGQELYGLVNNAGTAALGPIEFLPLDQIRQQFEVNLFGHIAVTQALLPQLRASRGRIVNVSSISGFIGFPRFGAYSASKFALEGLSDALRRELKGAGVSVSVIQPGNMDTDIWDTSYAGGKSLEDGTPEEARQIYGAHFGANPDGSHGPRRKSSPALVAAALVEAMTAPRPRCRYLVGADARRLHRLRRLLPDALLDRFI